MNIVVLDGKTLNPGDISWEGISNLGNLTIYDRTLEEQIVERSRDAQILLTNKTPLAKEVLNELPLLKYIGVLATGYNVVDVDYARSRGIPVSNIPGYGTASVVQMTIALLLELCQHVQLHSDSVRCGEWSRSPDFCYWKTPLVELQGKTMGIIGFGRIGRKVADVAQSLGMKIMGFARTHSDQSGRENFRWAEIAEILKESDVVSIHCPLFPETEGLINSDTLRTMKPSAFLLNTSRGPIVLDQDLADALNNDIIAGAGIDVLSVEPPPPDNPLFNAKNCIITPHIAWATKEARSRLMKMAEENLLSFIRGDSVNVINK